MHLNWEPTNYFQPNTPDPFGTHGIPLPTYGRYGGPNLSAGVEGGAAPEPADLNATNAPVDDLDLLFYEHDYIYKHSIDPAVRLAADFALVTGMQALTFTDPGDPDYDAEAGLFQGFATLGLVTQVLANDLFEDLPQPVQAALVSATQEAIVNFEAGLAEVPPGEARSLHGALHVFEAKYLDLLS
jgi:hypothetical protein